MRTVTFLAAAWLFCGVPLASQPPNDQATGRAKEVTLDAPNKVVVKVRMQAPYDAETPLQVVCYFKHKEAGDTTLGAAVELDEKLGGVIASLRNRGEFAGDELETFLLSPPEGTIKPRLLLLVGLGDEASLSLDTMKRVGQVAVREAARLGATRIAFAPLIRDQGNSRFAAGDVANAVVRGMLLGYDTEKRLQKEGLEGVHPRRMGAGGRAEVFRRHGSRRAEGRQGSLLSHRGSTVEPPCDQTALTRLD